MTNYTSNPVGSLQERFQSHGTKPHYKLVKVSGSAHDPTFSCQVSVRDLVSMGSGSSKKQAKNAAALAMLDKLDKMLPVNGKNQQEELVPVDEKTPARVNKMVPPVVLANLKSQARLDSRTPADERLPMLHKVVPANENFQSEDSASSNSVQTLHEMCTKLGYRIPEYELEGLDGQPQVGISILCSVGDLKQRGAGPSKDDAKIEAAQKMIDLLRSLMPNSFPVLTSIGKTRQDELPDKMDSLNIVTSKMVNSMSSKKVNGVSSRMVNENNVASKIVTSASSDKNIVSSKKANGNNVSSKNKIVTSASSGKTILSSNKENGNNVTSVFGEKNIMSSKKVNVNNVSSNQLTASSVQLESLHRTCLKEKTRDYITMLNELGKEQKIVVTHVEERSEDNIQCLVQLSTVPVAVGYAIGTDSETIHNEAARDILIYLKMLTKQATN